MIGGGALGLVEHRMAVRLSEIAEAAARIMGAWERVKEEIMAKRIPLSRASREADRVTEAFGGPMADASAGLANVEAEALEAVDRLVVAAGGIEKASMAWSRLTGGMSIYEDAVWSSLWSGCKHVYRIDRRVADELAAQGMDGSVPAEALRRLPYPIVYIEARITIGLDDRELGAAGFVAYRSGGELELVALCDGGLRVALDVPLDGDERSLADVVDEQLGEMERIARAGGGQLDRVGARGQMGRAYAAMLNLLLYVIHEEEDVEVVYAPARQGDGRKPGRRSNPETIELVGVRMGRALGAARRVAGGGSGGGSKKAPHMRRAHWQAFWTGRRKGRTDGMHGDELVLRWIPPIEVNGGGDSHETVHRG